MVGTFRLTHSFVFLSLSARVVGEDDQASEGSPEKVPRMKTNKKAATNFFTTANVKNKNRDRSVPKDRNGGSGKGSGKKRSGRKSGV